LYLLNLLPNATCQINRKLMNNGTRKFEYESEETTIPKMLKAELLHAPKD